MLKTIIWREFLANIITFRFLFALFICVGLVGTITVVLTRSYADKLKSYHLAVQANIDNIRRIQVYSELSTSGRPKADKMPRLTSILNEGVTGRVGNRVEVAHSVVPVLATRHGTDNPYLSVFPRIDLTFVFQIVISLMAFLFAYDAVAGEREDGTLALALSNSIPRGMLLLGKYLGGMLSLVIPLALSLLVALQVILFSPSVALSASDWGRIGLFSLVSLIYVSAFFTLGMLFSSRSRRAATALMLTMFFWVIFVLVWPNASAYAVSKLAPIKSDAELTMEGLSATLAKGEDFSQHPIGDLWVNQFRGEIDKYARQHGVQSLVDALRWLTTNYFEGQAFYGDYNGPAHKLSLFRDYWKFMEELRVQYGDKTGQMRLEYLNRYPIRQARLTRKIACISPAAAYADATAILAETDLDSHLRFLEQAKGYRNELLQYLRDQKAFESEAWYNVEAAQKINKEAIPRFRERPEPLSSSLNRAMGDIVILVLLNVAFFLLTYLSFLRYDVR